MRAFGSWLEVWGLGLKEGNDIETTLLLESI